MAVTTPVQHWKTVKATITVGNTLDIDTNPLAGLLGIDYHLTLYNEAQSKYLSLKIEAKRFGNDFNYRVYGHVGTQIARSIQVLVVGSDVALRITNGETFPLSIKGIKNKRSI